MCCVPLPPPQVCGPLPVDSVLSLPDDHPGRAALAEAHCAFIESWTRFLTIAAKLHVSQEGEGREGDGGRRGGEGRAGVWREGEGREVRCAHALWVWSCFCLPQPEEFSLGSDVVKGILDCVLEGLESHTRRSTGSTALRATAHLSQLLLVLVKPALE